MQVILSANQIYIMLSIVDVVAADKNLVTLAIGMKAAGLNEQLSKMGPFTVFAPTEHAFGKLQRGEWPDLLRPQNRVKLADIMNHHVINGTIHFKDLTDGQELTTLNGKKLAVHVRNGETDIDGAKIQGRDMDASNGVVHSLDNLVQ